MPDIRIEFNIDNPDPDYYENAWDIEGGLLVKSTDRTLKRTRILTQRKDDPDDDGFRGDYVFFNLWDWLTSILELLGDKKYYCELIDGGGTFLFEPKETYISFKYYLEDTEQLIEYENKRYPNYKEGTPLKIDELVAEIIRVSEQFINCLGPKIEDQSDVILFKKSLSEAREAYNHYLMGTKK